MTTTIDSFEEFLRGIHMKQNPQVLDDDLPDHFDNWLASIDADEWIDYGDLYGSYLLGRHD